MNLVERRQLMWMVLAILVGVILLRVIGLSCVPPNHDEGVLGWLALETREKGYYEYASFQFHGPLHFYALYLSQWLLGVNSWGLRLPSIILGTLTCGLVWGLRPWLSIRACLMAMVFMGISAAMALYSRWSIHEAGFTFFALLWMVSVLRLWFLECRWGLWGMMLALVGILTTKETAMITLGASLISLLTVHYGLKPEKSVRLPIPIWQWVMPVSLAVFLFLVIMTGAFQSWSGVAMFFDSLGEWQKIMWSPSILDRPWGYFITLLVSYEPIALVGLGVLIYTVIRNQGRGMPAPILCIGLMGLLSLVLYSLSPYKTAWCSLQWIPFFLIIGAYWADGWLPKPLLKKSSRAILAVSVLLIQLMLTVYTVGVGINADLAKTHGYYYLPSYRDALIVTDFVKQLAADNPQLKFNPNLMMLRNQWPLPWLLMPTIEPQFCRKGLKEQRWRRFWMVWLDEQSQESIPNSLKQQFCPVKFHLRPDSGYAFLMLNRQFVTGKACEQLRNRLT